MRVRNAEIVLHHAPVVREIVLSPDAQRCLVTNDGLCEVLAAITGQLHISDAEIVLRRRPFLRSIFKTEPLKQGLVQTYILGEAASLSKVDGVCKNGTLEETRLVLLRPVHCLLHVVRFGVDPSTRGRLRFASLCTQRIVCPIEPLDRADDALRDRKSTRLNSQSPYGISYA